MPAAPAGKGKQETFGQELTDQATPRPAPSASRTPISRRRAAPRPRSSPAMLAQPTKQHQSGEDRHHTDESKERQQRLRHAAETADPVYGKDLGLGEPGGQARDVPAAICPVTTCTAACACAARSTSFQSGDDRVFRVRLRSSRTRLDSDAGSR